MAKQHSTTPRQLPLLTPQDIERFWKCVNISENCWLWQGPIGTGNYGTFRSRARRLRAHRVSYFITYSIDPGLLLVCHHCDERLCVRPDHLFVGTQKDNLSDASRKGRMPGNITPCSPETKQKISQTTHGRPGRPQSLESKAKISAANKGKPATQLTPEGRARLHSFGLSRDNSHLYTPEAREKIALALRGRKQSDTQKLNTSLALCGKRKSEQHRANLSTALKASPVALSSSLRNVQVAIAANRGKHRSPETIAKIRASNIATKSKKKEALCLQSL